MRTTPLAIAALVMSTAIVAVGIPTAAADVVHVGFCTFGICSGYNTNIGALLVCVYWSERDGTPLPGWHDVQACV